MATDDDSDEAAAWEIPLSPWARRPRPKRATVRPALSQRTILDAAMRVLDAEGLDAVSLRRVAQELGTGAASLYTHIADKDDLLNLIIDRVLGEVELPERDPAAWQEQLKELVRAGHRAMLAHNDVARAFLGRIPFGANSLRLMDWQLALLADSGLSAELISYSGDLLGQYVVITAIEAGIQRNRAREAGPERMEQYSRDIQGYWAALPADRFPNVLRFFTAVDQMGLDRFELGLDVLMRGLAALAERG